MLGVVADRPSAAVDGWLGARPAAWLARIGTVALDPWRGYASALVASLGHATVVVDHLHTIRLANAVVDQVHPADPAGHPWPSGPQARPAVPHPQAGRLRRGPHVGGPRRPGALLLLGRRRRGGGAVQACRTVRAWEADILAWHATNGCSNGPTEAVNLLIKKVKRVGHGFRNCGNYRLRLLLHCGVALPAPRPPDCEAAPPRRVAERRLSRAGPLASVRQRPKRAYRLPRPTSTRRWTYSRNASVSSTLPGRGGACGSQPRRRSSRTC